MTKGFGLESQLTVNQPPTIEGSGKEVHQLSIGVKISTTERLLGQRVEALEERLEQMRLSRRVLLRILEQSELERKTEIAKLQVENNRLQRQNLSFAHRLMEKNQRIMTMQDQICKE